MATTRQQDAYAEVRKLVNREAQSGTQPSVGRYANLLEEAFDGFGGEEALARLEGVATEAFRQRAEKNRLHAQKRKVEDLAKRILKEQKEAEQRERLEAARAEARKRLGMPPKEK